jgi:hypothetical protein
MKMTKIKANECQLLRPEIDEALRKVADYYGLVHKVGKMTYANDGNNVTMKLEFAVPSTTGDVMTREATVFKTNAGMLGFYAEDLFKPFTYGRRQMKIIGYNGRKRNYPIMCQYTDGAHENVKLTITGAQTALKAVRGDGPWDKTIDRYVKNGPDAAPSELLRKPLEQRV